MNKPWTIIGLWLACLVIAGVWVARIIDVQHDLKAFIPSGDQPVESLLLSRTTSSALSRLIFVAFEGGTLEQRLAASRDAMIQLGDIDGVEQVANGMRSFDVQTFQPLFPYRYLLNEPPSLDADGLRTALQTRLKELRSPLAVVVRSDLAADPTATFRDLLRRFGETATEPRREDGLWVTPDRTRSLMLLTIADSGGDLGREEEVVLSITRMLDRIASEQEVELLLAGQPAMTSAARDSIRRSFVIGGGIACLLVVTLLLWLFRSIGVLFLGILPLATGALAGVAAVLAIFGGVHGIALAFGVTLLGIAIDYPLHLFSRHRAGEHLAMTAKTIERPLFLGVITTASAFAVFGVSSAPGLAQLAAFTAVGVIVAAATLRYVVPATASVARIQPKPRALQPLPDVPPKWLSIVLVLVAIAAIAWLPLRNDPLLASDIGALNPLPDSARQLDRKLRSDLGAPDLRHLLLITGDDPEIVLQRSESLVDDLSELVGQGGLAGFDAPSRYLPSANRQKARQGTLPTPSEIERALAVAGKGLPFSTGVFQTFIDAIERSRTMAPLDAKAGHHVFASTPLGPKLDQLLLRHDGRWHGFLPLIGVEDLDGPRQLATTYEAVQLIDLRAFSNELLSDVSIEALWLLGLSIAGAGILLFLLRHPGWHIAASLAVLLLTLAVTTAVLLLIGERLTMLHIMAALLVVGLGIDYSVFFAWKAGDEERRGTTLRSLLACVLSTVVVFGMLAVSSISVLRAIGLTVAIGACTSFAYTYVILTKRPE